MKFTEDELSDFMPEVAERFRRLQEKRDGDQRARTELTKAVADECRTRDRLRECSVALRKHLGNLAAHSARVQNAALPWIGFRLDENLRKEWEGLSKRIGRVRSEAAAGCGLSSTFLTDYAEVISQAENAADTREVNDAAARARNAERTAEAERNRVEMEAARAAMRAEMTEEERLAEDAAMAARAQRLIASRRKGPIELKTTSMHRSEDPYDWESDPAAVISAFVRPS